MSGQLKKPPPWLFLCLTHAYNEVVRKYWIILKNQIGLVSTYRVDLLTRWVMNSFDVIVNVALWSLVTGGDQQQINKLILYFTLYYGILNNIHTSRTAAWISRDILNGDINQYLIKPIYFPLVQVIKSSTLIIVRILVPLLILVTGSFLYPAILAPISLTNLVFCLIFMSLSTIIWNSMTISFSTISFLGTETSQFFTALDLTINLLKGAYIPAYLFSPYVTRLLSFTFIPYLASFPIRLYQEIVSPAEILQAFLVAVAWAVFFTFTATYFYRRGLRVYEAQGS